MFGVKKPTENDLNPQTLHLTPRPGGTEPSCVDSVALSVPRGEKPAHSPPANFRVDVQQGASDQVARRGAEDGRRVEDGCKASRAGGRLGGAVALRSHTGHLGEALPHTRTCLPSTRGHPLKSGSSPLQPLCLKSGRGQLFKGILKFFSQNQRHMLPGLSPHLGALGPCVVDRKITKAAGRRAGAPMPPARRPHSPM